MKFPSPAFDDAVAAACHGTADDECLAALAALLQIDEAALDAYLWQTELHATLLTSTQFVEPAELALIGEVLESGGGSGAKQRRGTRAPGRLVAAAWIGVTTLGLALGAWLAASLWTGMDGARRRPADASAQASPPAAAIVGSFDSLDGVEWVAAETDIRVGDPLRSGQRIELARGSVGLEFNSGASVRLTGPVIFEAESPMTAILTMGRVAVIADTPESKGFTIRTRTGRIVDLGTEFTAESLPDGRCRIGVSSGSVRFHPGERGAGHLLRAGDLMEVEPGQRQVITRIERGDESPAFRFASIEPPSAADAADSSRGRASIRCMLGRLYENPNIGFVSPGPEILVDGKGQSMADAPHESLHFANNQTGGILIDLGAVVPVTKVNVYSWHSCMNPGFPEDLRQAHRERAAQKYVLYGSAASEPPEVGDDPVKSGWTLVARVNSDDYFGLTGIERPAQQASSIGSDRGTIGRFRHLLFVVQPTAGVNHDGRELNFATLFGEIDVCAE